MEMNIKKASILAMLAIGCSFTIIAPAAKAQDAAVQQTLAKGDKAPDFSLKDQDGKTFKLSDVVGKKTGALLLSEG